MTASLSSPAMRMSCCISPSLRACVSAIRSSLSLSGFGAPFGCCPDEDVVDDVDVADDAREDAVCVVAETDWDDDAAPPCDEEEGDA